MQMKLNETNYNNYLAALKRHYCMHYEYVTLAESAYCLYKKSNTGIRRLPTRDVCMHVHIPLFIFINKEYSFLHQQSNGPVLFYLISSGLLIGSSYYMASAKQERAIENVPCEYSIKICYFSFLMQ